MSKILIVEDEEAIADLEKDYLELSDFEVDICNSGDKGLKAALDGNYDLVILDEPTSFLDMRHKLQLLSILKEMVNTKNIGVLMSLHELDLAQKISDTVVCVRGDRIDKVGSPETVFTSDYIAELYAVEKGSYDPLFGSMEMPSVKGEPKVFVIGGGGTGVPIYRKLQRKGIPFAAGILWNHDIDYSVAKLLASEIVEGESYEPVKDATLEYAKALMDRCESVVCTQSHFGSFNRCNEELLKKAKEEKKLKQITEL